MSTRGFAPAAIARSLRTIFTPEWDGLVSPRARQYARGLHQEQRVLSSSVGHALLDDSARRRLLPAALANRFRRKETNVEESRIDYVLGSGNHARSYLHRTARGTLIELPLGWYAEKGGYWGMSPGFDSRHPATRRLVSYECIFCHDGYPRIPAGHDAPGSEPVFSGDLPEGIDCQRCHGPGGSHVRTAQTAGADSRTDSRQHRESRPAQSEAADGSLHAMSPGADQHGDSSADPAVQSRAVFLHPRRAAGRFRAVFRSCARHRGTTTSLKSSAVPRTGFGNPDVFCESKEALTCDTCHDPHRIPARGGSRPPLLASLPPMPRRCFRWAGLQRHASRRRPIASPAICRSAGPRTLSTSSMTDHLIQRRPPLARPAGRTRRTSPHRGRGVPRRGGSLLPTGVAPSRPGRSLPGAGAGGDEEQSARGCRRTGPPGGPATTTRSRVVHSARRRLAGQRRTGQGSRRLMNGQSD